jgi:hypothetical protein
MHACSHTRKHQHTRALTNRCCHASPTHMPSTSSRTATAGGRGRGGDDYGWNSRGYGGRGYGRDDYGRYGRDDYGRYGRDGPSHRSVYDDRERSRYGDRFSGRERYPDTYAAGDRYGDVHTDMYAGAIAGTDAFGAGRDMWLGMAPPGMLPPAGVLISACPFSGCAHTHKHTHTRSNARRGVANSNAPAFLLNHVN